MVEDGSFGGPTCAPVAEKIYEAMSNGTNPKMRQARPWPAIK